jgi:hypothetical protein
VQDASDDEHLPPHRQVPPCRQPPGRHRPPPGPRACRVARCSTHRAVASLGRRSPTCVPGAPAPSAGWRRSLGATTARPPRAHGRPSACSCRGARQYGSGLGASWCGDDDECPSRGRAVYGRSRAHASLRVPGPLGGEPGRDGRSGGHPRAGGPPGVQARTRASLVLAASRSSTTAHAARCSTSACSRSSLTPYGWHCATPGWP